MKSTFRFEQYSNPIKSLNERKFNKSQIGFECSIYQNAVGINVQLGDRTEWNLL